MNSKYLYSMPLSKTMAGMLLRSKEISQHVWGSEFDSTSLPRKMIINTITLNPADTTWRWYPPSYRLYFTGQKTSKNGQVSCWRPHSNVKNWLLVTWCFPGILLLPPTIFTSRETLGRSWPTHRSTLPSWLGGDPSQAAFTEGQGNLGLSSSDGGLRTEPRGTK